MAGDGHEHRHHRPPLGNDEDDDEDEDEDEDENRTTKTPPSTRTDPLSWPGPLRGRRGAVPSRAYSASLCASPRERLACDSVRFVMLPCSRVQRRSARGRRKSKGVSQDAVEVRFPSCSSEHADALACAGVGTSESSPAGLSVASSSQARILAQQGAPVQAARGREGIRRHTTHTHHTHTHLVNKQARKHTQTQTGRYKMLIQPPEQHEYDVATAASLAFSVSVLSHWYVVYGNCVEVFCVRALHHSLSFSIWYKSWRSRDCVFRVWIQSPAFKSAQPEI